MKFGNLTASAMIIILAVFVTSPVYGFGFVFSNEANPDRVMHQIGYTGASGNLTITVGIDPTSIHAAEMVIPTQNVVTVWNNLVATTGNLKFGEIPFTEYDFESVLLHEMGHSLGLRHPNLASESGLPPGPDQNYTQSGQGANAAFDLDPGVDGVIGSADDVRGDDVNLNYFRTADNDPFDTSLGVVDSTTYSRDIANLPGGDSYSANADRDVGAALGYTNTEAILQQGTFNNETQRTLGADDVAGIRYSLTGLDETVGGGDDYTFTLQYIGLDAGADIVIDFDDTETGFAVSQSSLVLLSGEHWAINSSNIFFNDSVVTWHFNATPVPEPSAVLLLAICVLFLFCRSYSKNTKRPDPTVQENIL